MRMVNGESEAQEGSNLIMDQREEGGYTYSAFLLLAFLGGKTLRVVASSP